LSIIDKLDKLGTAGLLYVNGGDINAKDNNGFTPLYVALAKGGEAVADLLRMHGGQA